MGTGEVKRMGIMFKKQRFKMGQRVVGAKESDDLFLHGWWNVVKLMFLQLTILVD